MEIVTAIVTPVVESLMVPVKKHLGYLFSCTKYVRDMGSKVRELNATRRDAESHMKQNAANNLEIPSHVTDWLKETENANEKVESVPSDVGTCFNLKGRHKLGRKAFKIIQDIDRLLTEYSRINWTDHPIPLGKVDSFLKASSSTPSSHHNDFKSREQTFMEALKALELDRKSHMIALCGMGGVGKTTMMEKLKKVVIEKKMFDIIVEATIGEKTDPIAIQQSIADFLSIDLTEKTKVARASKLRKSFEARSDGGKNKILVILDDVWQLIDLNDIGLSLFPNQLGVDFKVLMTSRNRHVCTMMGVEVDSIFNVEVITDPEAQSFFHRFVKFSDDIVLDLHLRKIGDDIASRCHGLPIAIRTIAYTLKDKRNKHVWEDTLCKLKNHDVGEVLHQIFEMSYNNLQNEEARSTLLLCGLFPEDFDIPTEDLVRYGWGLKLFYKVCTIKEARDRLNTCIEQLIDANLLIQSQYVGCVKMHDLVRAFVLDMCSKEEHASIVGCMSNWNAKDTSMSCKRISVTCTGMSEFPRDCKYPNLLLLKLMHGDMSLKFPEDFYQEMQKLEVISYDNMEYPLLSRSLQCSSNLRTLSLHQCSLMFDCSSIGNLVNLEVLSFAHCNIRKLPSTIGNLKKLKLLDLTGCMHLCIDDGVLNNLVKLEELYMRVLDEYDIKFTDSNYNELVERSKNLLAIEIEFLENNALIKNISFTKLERFRISLECYLEQNDNEDRHSFENTLRLCTTKHKLLDSRLNELFEKTEVLYFHIDGIHDLGEVLVEPLHHHPSSFYNLRVLEIRKCATLRYLFTAPVANGLTNLERLTISSCPVLETIVHSETSGVEVIKFQSLKFLSFCELPKLTSLSNAANVIELPRLLELQLNDLPNFTSIYPKSELATSSMLSNIFEGQSFLKEEVVISELKILRICNMEKLKEIWPSEFNDNEEVSLSTLRVLVVIECDSLVDLFPRNPLSLLHRLEELEVRNCGSIDVLFNIDLESCAGELEEACNNLRSIQVSDLKKLREVLRVKGVNDSNLPISVGFQALECIKVIGCRGLRNLFTPTTINFDMGALRSVTIDGINGWGENNEMVEISQEEEINVTSNKDKSEVDDNIPNVSFPSYLIHPFHHVRKLKLFGHKNVEVAFEIKSLRSRKPSTILLPYLKDLHLHGMDRMAHVWKYNSHQLLISQPEPTSSFHNLTEVTLSQCKVVKYLFSPIMVKLLSNLKIVNVYYCDAFEEVVTNKYDDVDEIVASISSFPHLERLSLYYLPCLKCIDGVGAGGNKLTSNDKVQFWTLCQYVKRILIEQCHTLISVVPSHAIGQLTKLEDLKISCCPSLTEIFETERVNDDVGCNTNVGDTMTIPRLTYMALLEFPNLKKLRIYGCGLLKNVFTSSTLGSLKKLEELEIDSCKTMKVIVKEENGGHTIASKDDDQLVYIFPRLKSLTLANLPNLEGFFTGKNDFLWPSLDMVKIYGCPQMMSFTSGHSMAPKLNYMHTGLGKHSLECGINFDWTNTSHQNQRYNSTTCSTPDMIKFLQFPWSFSNVIDIVVGCYHELSNLKMIFQCNECLKLQNGETPDDATQAIEEPRVAFKVLDGTNADLISKVQSDVIFSKQKEMSIMNEIYQPTLILSNLTKVSFLCCYVLEHVFCYCMVGRLGQLRELHLESCHKLEVIVKQGKDSESKLANEILFPSLKSLKLISLRSLKGFYLGRETFQWPSLDTLEIKNCPEITIFTNGQLATNKLKVIDTSFGLCEATEDLNSFIMNKRHEGYKL